MQILKELHGIELGIGPNGEFIVPSGIVLLGKDGAQTSLASRAEVNQFDDFLGPTLSTRWTATAGTDSPAGGAITAAVDGRYRLTTGDSNASLAADGIQLTSSLNWKANQGGLVFETRLQASAITALQLFAGLTDQVAALEMPATLSVVTFTTVATDAVGFLLDTNATTDTIRMVGVANDVDATMQDSANAWAAATDIVLRIEVTAGGAALFFINGTQIGTLMSGAVTPTVALAPVICARSLAANSKTIDLDYIDVRALRV